MICRNNSRPYVIFTCGMNKGFNNAANKAGVKLSCFVEVTFVMTVAGMVAVENIRAGDKVISTNPDTKRQVSIRAYDEKGK